MVAPGMFKNTIKKTVATAVAEATAFFIVVIALNTFPT